MSRRTVQVRKLRAQQSDLTRVLPRKAVSDGRKTRIDGPRRSPGIASGKVGTVPMKPDTEQRWSKLWGKD